MQPAWAENKSTWLKKIGQRSSMVNFSFFLYQILIIELLRERRSLDDDRQMKLFNWNVPVFIQNLYKYIGFFVFGAACCQLTTDIAKYSIGRYRPHFISVSLNIFPF